MTCTWECSECPSPDGALDDLYLTEPWMTPTSRSMEWMTCSYSNLQTEYSFYSRTHPHVSVWFWKFVTRLLGGKWAEERLGDILASIRYTCKQTSGIILAIGIWQNMLLYNLKGGSRSWQVFEGCTGPWRLMFIFFMKASSCLQRISVSYL